MVPATDTAAAGPSSGPLSAQPRCPSPADTQTAVWPHSVLIKCSCSVTRRLNGQDVAWESATLPERHWPLSPGASARALPRALGATTDHHPHSTARLRVCPRAALCTRAADL